ncbi:glycosyltransferase family 2 protein [Psychroserpens sp.]|uniref:glycosyltransferase family 2 protein n=1 Tax=Psychroserpens sp. TaxID=2020870 RepID=UPI003C757320
MISVLIPVYNYDIAELVKTVHRQLVLCAIPFEMICLDDASEVRFQNQKTDIETYAFTTYYISEDNQGRIATRQQLATSATYDNLLFLDADVLPKSDAFIKNYVAYLTSNTGAIYGGFAYQDERPEKAFMLRYIYGKNNEEIPAFKRNKHPYKIVISGNFLIKKDIFTAINSKIKYEGYGFDNYFGALLKTEQIKVLHIDNEVYHLGIEPSETYLSKKEKAALTLVQLYNDDPLLEHDNHLLKLFTTFKRYKLNYLASFFFKVSQTALRKNLLGSRPNINYLQLYRIGYMCSKDLQS